MILAFAVLALLWLVLLVLLFALGVVLFFPGHQLTMWERSISAVVIVLLAAPLAQQLRTLAARRREWKSNAVTPGSEGIRIRLGGYYRAAKGLPDVSETCIPWSDVTDITKERRKFIYASLIPFEYPLDVYSIVSLGAKFAFTSECVIGAKGIAQEIAARLGRPVRIC